MREVSHLTSTELPPPIVMSHDELWDAVGVMSRVMREANRRQMPRDLVEKLDVSRGIVLGMHSTVDCFLDAS